jgi:hypothetical protein
VGLLKLLTMAKAKYEVLVDWKVSRTFVTTTRSEDEMIKELSDRYTDYWGRVSIRKTENGKSKIVYGKTKNHQ